MDTSTNEFREQLIRRLESYTRSVEYKIQQRMRWWVERQVVSQDALARVPVRVRRGQR